MYTVAASRALPYPVAVSLGGRRRRGVRTAPRRDDFRADAAADDTAGRVSDGHGDDPAGRHRHFFFGVHVGPTRSRSTRSRIRVVVRVGDFGGKVIVAEVSSAVATTIELRGRNYDPDGDGLIDVVTTSQLAAIRHDLSGDGLAGVSDANRKTYRAAFPLFDAALTCPDPDGCDGYELSNDIFLGVSSFPDGWTPIGGGVPNRGSYTSEEYTGIFEGNGFVISSMSIVSTDARLDNVGLFGVLASGE